MLKILSTDQVREADRVTIERASIESVDLMERAGAACVDWFVETYESDRHVVVLAGVGNNGGDALVMARRLIEKGYQVDTYIVRYSEKFSTDLQVNLDRLIAANHEVHYILEEEHFPAIASRSVVVDGLFGSGLNRPVDGLAALCIDQVNASIAEVVCIDMPSGLFADKCTQMNGSVISASYTLSFQVPKLAFFMPENSAVIGRWRLIHIGLDPKYLASVNCPTYFVNDLTEYTSYFARDRFDHKGKFGHALLIGGSYGMIGAAVLAAQAALRTGVGKLTVHIPSCGYDIVQTSIPEAMCSVDDHEECIGELPVLGRFNAIAIGPGLGQNKKSRRALKALLKSAKVPLVLDADALNMMAENKDFLNDLPKNSVLTPHAGEFERLFGPTHDSFERIKQLKAAAKKYHAIIALKGARTTIAAPDGSIYINSTGNPGMATAGSGDVLTGIITSFIAQFKDPLVATICGVYLHGLAADMAKQVKGEHGLIASDIVQYCGPAIQSILAYK
ncbi:MAG: NAD(P)H-hydrate dehydratase [Cryomorphaceae bacterium]